MKKTISGLFIASVFITSCGSPDVVLNQSIDQGTANISSTKPAKPVKNSLNASFTKLVAESLDLNKDGSVDATESPIVLYSKDYKDTISNNDASAISGYLPTKPISVATIADKMENDYLLSVHNSKTSDNNKSKIATALANALVKDSLAESNKVYGYATTVGYFTGKTTAMVRNMDSGLLAKRILQQFDIGNGTINGVPYQSANGSVSISPSFVTIDGKYKSRINFTDYDRFESGIQLVGSHKITDAASKIVK